MDRILARRAEGIVARLRGVLPARGRARDVGAGTGHTAAALARHTDLVPIEVDVVRMRSVPHGLVLFDGAELPFASGAFACSLLLFVLHYAADPRRLLMEARRVTAGSVIMLQSTHRGTLAGPVAWVWEALSGQLAFAVARAVGFVPPDTQCSLSPRRHFTSPELMACIETASLRVRREEHVRWPALGLSTDLYVLE
jgi:SAM-dependent methyltransferase